MQYVKLIAKPNTWFKEGTEVYHYDCNPPEYIYRISLEEWNRANDKSYSGWCIYARGIHVIESETEANNVGGKVGEERWDGEWCHLDEFEAQVVKERK